MQQCSPLFPIFRAAFTVIPLLPNATVTPSIQPNLGLPRTRPPLTSAIIPFWQYDTHLFFQTRPNHLNTLWSALLAKSLYIPALLRTSWFLTLSIHDTPTKLLKHFISRTFTFSLSTSHTPCICSEQRSWHNYTFTVTSPLSELL